MNMAEKYCITAAEKEAIIKRIAQRFRDYVYINAEGMCQRALGRHFESDIITDETIKVTFIVEQVVGDMLVELGALRRENKPSDLAKEKL